MTPRALYYAVHGRRPARRQSTQPSARRLIGPARSPKYKAWIRSLPCAACGAERDVEAAHTVVDMEPGLDGVWSAADGDTRVVLWTPADRGGMALKSSDYSCIPLCTDCHTMAPDSYHRDRVEFERRVEAAQGCTVRQLVARLNHDWFAYSRLTK